MLDCILQLSHLTLSLCLLEPTELCFVVEYVSINLIFMLVVNKFVYVYFAWFVASGHFLVIAVAKFV